MIYYYKFYLIFDLNKINKVKMVIENFNGNLLYNLNYKIWFDIIIYMV